MIESLSAISVFVKVAQMGSFVSAGRALGLSASAVGKRVTSLESSVGTQLLQRNTRRISLTYDGERFLGHALRIVEEIEEMQNAMHSANQEPNGKIRISIAPVPNLFIDKLYGFLEKYKNIDIEFDFSDRFVDLVGENFDAALRIGYKQDGNVRCHQIGYLVNVIVASPIYLSNFGKITNEDDLLSHKLIHYRSKNSGLIQPWPLASKRSFDLPHSIICNDVDTRIKLAVKGAGIAYLPAVSINIHLETGELCTILDDQITDTRVPIHAVWPYAHRYSLRQRLLIDYLKNIQI
ncbi:LysR family transcriptional regulator [Agrobacterium vitis]|uniref:LysR family transcriptional regulator n=1 Tax=Agrobacterium vitis TaxID=373 RepID=UPI0009BFC64E|nr:LysR family transcriptional regulator [Agrobacterium vitis]MCE6078520.1 LysR family transcriptional regulator [Agrobacterium vitis]MCF1455075.1 LysR family transcriptional regulator [Agrobacterium vitis]MCF1469213.1 LysR family transcriptional regulator [Agrobacterium vitis]MCM2453730.1 LysR family transcriptional regulator [Agrobacterium vitis]MUO73478.1 LysR family transcriptional regulator [Agrobacterium vitis]